jgi:hypothetical protein
MRGGGITDIGEKKNIEESNLPLTSGANYSRSEREGSYAISMWSATRMSS